MRTAKKSPSKQPQSEGKPSTQLSTPGNGAGEGKRKKTTPKKTVLDRSREAILKRLVIAPGMVLDFDTLFDAIIDAGLGHVSGSVSCEAFDVLEKEGWIAKVKLVGDTGYRLMPAPVDIEKGRETVTMDARVLHDILTRLETATYKSLALLSVLDDQFSAVARKHDDAETSTMANGLSFIGGDVRLELKLSFHEVFDAFRTGKRG